MKCARLCSTPSWLAIILCAAGLPGGLLPVGVAFAATEPAAHTAGVDLTIDEASRAHTIELGIKDLRLRQEGTLPSIEDAPMPLGTPIPLPEDSPCQLPEPAIACTRRAELDLAPTTGGDAGSLHRLRRDTREAQDSHGPGHLIEESLERMAEPRPD